MRVKVPVQPDAFRRKLGDLAPGVDPDEQAFYSSSCREWTKVLKQFPSTRDDIEEARKCLALGRYPASIFHLMRVTEGAVLELGKLLDPKDFKPQFSSVLKKIDQLVENTKWQDWQEELKIHKPLFEEVLPRLYSVKDSWRDKAVHCDTHLIPADTVSNPERALEIYNSTLSLLRLLAERLPQ